MLRKINSLFHSNNFRKVPLKQIRAMSLQLRYTDTNAIECGLDEVGRGCLAGPVVAAAVILPALPEFSEVNDSKKLSAKKRAEWEVLIKKKAIAWSVSEVPPSKIDDINILNASFLAMNEAVEMLSVKPEFLLVDGNRFKTTLGIPYACIVKGDGKYAAIAAASILAKNYRDQLMAQKAKLYPGYGWETNVGYPTIEHRRALNELGITPLHRKSFNLSYQLKVL